MHLACREGSLDYNPHLKQWQRPEPNKAAGKGNIERPGQTINIVHQTRKNSPTDYENLLGNALEEIFDNDLVELKDIISRLNEMGVRAPNGADWSEESFRSEMEHLGS